MTTLQDIEAAFVAWALHEEPVRAAIVVGSQARTDHPADPWSDLDIILFARDPGKYLENTTWYEAFSPVWTSIQSRTVAGEPEHLVLYAGGLQVDFIVNDTTVLTGLPQMIASGQLPDTIHRGVRVLFDKDHLIPPLPAPGIPPAHLPPTQADFTQAWRDFWFSSVHAAKQLRRGDLAFYKAGEQRSRNLLLPFLEWYTRASRGWNTDTWQQGRFLSEWLDPALYTEFSRTFTPLESVSSWQGFQCLLDLAQPIIHDTALKLGYHYPQDIENTIRTYIDTLSPAGQ